MLRQRGFSLIELVIVMLIISGGMLGLAGVYGTAAKSEGFNETLQQAAQYGQECAENALAARHDNGFAAMASFTCSTGTCPGTSPACFNFSRSVTSNVLSTGTATTTCPNGIQCRTLVISTSSNSNPSLNSSITVMLVSY